MHNPITHPTLLHPLTGEPLEAVGIVNGRIIWPIMGASEDSDDANDGGSDDGDNDGDDADDDGDKDAGDDGDKDKDGDAAARMLIDERNGRKTAETLLAELTGKSKTEVRKLLRGGAAAAREALVTKKKDDGKKDGDKDDAPDADAIRRDAERAAEERVNGRIVRAEVKALAADTFADPADAHLYLDLTDFDVDDDGDVDEDEIKKALADVLRKKPHLAKKGKGPKSDPSQGPRGGSKPDPGTGVNRMKAAYANSAKKK